MKRENGRGSVYFEKSRKRWAVAITLSDGRRKVKRFQDKQAAENYLEDLHSSMRHGGYIPQENITIGQWLITYINTYKVGHVKRATYTTYLSFLSMLEPIAALPLQKETGINIQHFFNTVNLSPATKRALKTFLSGAIKKAAALSITPRNFVDTVELNKAGHKKIEVFSLEELKRIKTALNGSRIFPLFLIGEYTGMRPGEIMALTWADIDTVNKTITVSKNVYDGVMQKSPKTSHSNRTISIGNELNKYLIDYRERHDGPGLIFHQRGSGKPLNRNYINKLWKSKLAASGIKVRPFYCLRHTHASILLANNVPITEVSARLGHANSSVTLRVYAHWVKDKSSGAGDKLESFFT